MKKLKKLNFCIIALSIVLGIIGCVKVNANSNIIENNNLSIMNKENISGVRLKYMGQATIRIITEYNKVIYIDPFAGDDYNMNADLILQTHNHFDHSDLAKVKNRNENCVIITEKEAVVNGVHKIFDLGFVKIVPVEAGYNMMHNPLNAVGYVLEFNNGIKVYVSGDTSKTKQMAEMSNMNIDYAFFCTDGVFNMGNDEAAECAILVNAKHNIPYHNDISNEGLKFDKKKAEEWNAPNKLILDVNQEIVLN